jgi:hypothetical protein
VALYQGTVLCLSEERRYLAETGPLSPFIRRTLAPGIYLLSPADMEAARESLSKSGVDIIARPALPRPDESPLHSPYTTTAGIETARNNGGYSWQGVLLEPPPAPAALLSGAAPGLSARERKAELRGALEKSRLTGTVKEELNARIERRLIVSESQLHDGVVKQEKLEARNLDYTGKAIIAKQALAYGSLVEIALPEAGSGERRLFGALTALEKNGGETILVLRPVSRSPEIPGNSNTVADSPGGSNVDGELSQDSDADNNAAEKEKETELIKIPLGKISLIRRIKQSLFEE